MNENAQGIVLKYKEIKLHVPFPSQKWEGVDLFNGMGY